MMLPAWGSVGFDDRGGRATAASSQPLALASKPPVLGRRTITLIAFGGILAIVYGTLVPFNFQWHRPLCWELPLLHPHGGDALANVLVYAPMGVFLRLLVRRRGSRWPTEYLLTLLLAASISYGTELLQSFLPARVPSLTDTVFNVSGALVGAMLAPAFQRRLREFHAWLYVAMRIEPFAAASALVTVCIIAYALAPFDIRPTPGHVTAALGRLQHSVAAGLTLGYGVAVPDVLDKWAASASYGLLAFLLVLAAREGHRGMAVSAWTGLSRSCCLAMSVEAVQLFTVSHVADWRDVEIAALFCGTGTVVACLLIWLRPLAHADPAALIGPAVPFVCTLLAAWACVGVLRNVSLGQAHRAGQWLPIMGSFNRSWDGLLATYAIGLINYGLAAGLFVLWCRLRRTRPTLLGCVMVPLLAAGVLQVLLKAVLSASYDTSHLVLALVAGVIMYRADRAVCGRQHGPRACEVISASSARPRAGDTSVPR